MKITNDVLRLAYIEIEAKDLQAWRTFAQDVLCAQVVQGDSADTLLLRMDNRIFRVALKQGPMDDICALGLELDNQQAFERTRNALQASGHLPVMGTQEQRLARGVTELMSTTDPAGLSVEFSYGAFVRPQTPFHPPRAHAGFVTGDQGLGHVLLSVPDTGKAQKFYQDVLGFRVSDYVVTNYNGRDASFIFMRCNSRHHTLAVGDLPVGKRLMHFMMQCRELDDVGYAQDRIPASGLRQTRSLGRHINDKMISFYMETPSKVQVEYGYGGLDVDESQNWPVSTYNVTSTWGHKHL